MATFGYALAMRVLQSPLYRELSELERKECDELAKQGLAYLLAQLKKE